jgi:hypothetical protein
MKLWLNGRKIFRGGLKGAANRRGPQGSTAPNLGQEKGASDFVSECLAGFEFHNIFALDFDLRPGLGIAACAGFSVDITKGTEADQGHPAVSFLQAFRHPFQKRFQRPAGGGFTHICILCHLFNQFCLCHLTSLSLNLKTDTIYSDNNFTGIF